MTVIKHLPAHPSLSRKILDTTISSWLESNTPVPLGVFAVVVSPEGFIKKAFRRVEY